MANPNPKIENLTPFEALGDRPLAKKVIGTRYPEEVAAVLRSLPSDDMQSLIRAAVEAKLIELGLLKGAE